MQDEHHESRERLLVSRVRRGEQEALEEIFRIYYDDLCAFAHRLLGSAAAAEDVVADVFVRIWKRRSEWDPRSTLRAYLFRAARNGCLDHLNQQQRRDLWSDTLGDDHSAHGQHADENVHLEELLQAVERTISILPEGQRQIFLMSRRHGLTYAEIGTVLGIARKTVETQMSRALKTFRKELSAYTSVS